MVPGSSAGKESACNAGDPGSIPGLERSPGEKIGYPLQDYWAFLVAQTVKNPSATQETREDPLEEGMATHSSILAWRIPMDRGAWWAAVPGGHKELDMTKHSTTCSRNCAVLGDKVGKKTGTIPVLKGLII